MPCDHQKKRYVHVGRLKQEEKPAPAVVADPDAIVKPPPAVEVYRCQCGAMVRVEGEIKTYNQGLGSDGRFVTDVTCIQVQAAPPWCKMTEYVNNEMRIVKLEPITGDDLQPLFYLHPPPLPGVRVQPVRIPVATIEEAIEKAPELLAAIGEKIGEARRQQALKVNAAQADMARQPTGIHPPRRRGGRR